MASYTQHYQLHQWEPTDDFLRTDFNQDHQKIDAAIKATEEALRSGYEGEASRLYEALAAAQQTLRSEFNGGFQNVNAALAALQQAMGQKLELVSGSFTGTSPGGTATPQDITLGFQPKLVISGAAGFSYVASNGYDCNCVVIYPGTICAGTTTQGRAELSITSTGFRVTNMANENGVVFQYVAFR